MIFHSTRCSRRLSTSSYRDHPPHVSIRLSRPQSSQPTISLDIQLGTPERSTLPPWVGREKAPQPPNLGSGISVTSFVSAMGAASSQEFFPSRPPTLYLSKEAVRCVFYPSCQHKPMLNHRWSSQWLQKLIRSRLQSESPSYSCDEPGHEVDDPIATLRDIDDKSNGFLCAPHGHYDDGSWAIMHVRLFACIIPQV